jgi:hypothetical protein
LRWDVDDDMQRTSPKPAFKLAIDAMLSYDLARKVGDVRQQMNHKWP